MTAQKDMAELGLDEQGLIEKQAKLKQLLYGPHKLGAELMTGIAQQTETQTARDTITQKPARKRRSDAGKPKKAPAIAQQPGFLLPEQAARLTDLINTQETRRVELECAEAHVGHCQGRLDAVRQELYDYLAELQGEGK